MSLIVFTFFIAFPQSSIALNVSSDVSGILTTSKSFITGTGLKKWSPPNLSSLEDASSIRLLQGNGETSVPGP